MASYKRGQLFEDNDDGNEDAEEEWGPTKIRGPGYTPFQFVPISDEQIKHEVRASGPAVLVTVMLTMT